MEHRTETHRTLPRHQTLRTGLLLLVATLLVAPSLWAAPFSASTEGELIAAILDANNESIYPGQDTITLAANITVTAKYSPGAFGANGLPTIFSDIIVDGQGYTVDRSSSEAFRFFQVNPVGTLTLIDLTLAGGSTGTGGAIRNNGGVLTLINTTVWGNGATTGGGGIYSDGSTTLEQGSEVSNNLAFQGGGLFVEAGTMTLTDATVTHNDAVAQLKNGGGLFVEGGTAILIDSTVSDNFAGADGGGIGGLVSPGSSVILDHSTITANTANSQGGGLYVGREGTASLYDSTVSDNAATDGGGIRLHAETVAGVRDCGSLTLEASTVSDNTAANGGGLHVGPECQATLTNSTISSNIAGLGGGLFVSQDGATTLTNTTVAANGAMTPDSLGQYFDSIYIDTSGAPGIVFDGGNLKRGAAKTLADDPVTLINSLVSNFGAYPHLNCNLPVADGGNSQVSYDNGTFDSCAVFSALSGLEATLADNGGATQTHALECGSSAIDAADSCGLVTDQRGFPRDDGLCDSGSYELQTVDEPGPLYPIALSADTVAAVGIGVPTDIFNGVQPGNFGWLTWTGDPSVPALAASLTPPGNSHLYVNPYDTADEVVSLGDWVQGSPGVSNAREIRELLDDLIASGANGERITVPIWDAVEDSGNNSNYQVSGFAEVQIIDYHLPRDDMISAIIHGLVVPGCSPN